MCADQFLACYQSTLKNRNLLRKEKPMLSMLPLPSRFLRILLMTLVAGWLAVPTFCCAEYLVDNQVAAQLGLERAWFAQIRVDPSRGKVVHWLLDKGQLYALTSEGAVQSIDAETGKTLWTTEVGAGHAAAAGMAVNSDYVALLGASRLYILDRTDGHHLWSRRIGGAASAAPALSETYAYVVLLSGLVEGYQLDDPSAYVWQYQSHGRTFQSPTTTGNVVSWPSDRGLLYVGQANKPRVMFRVETNEEIVAAPAELEPYLYVASLDGYLYCFHELTGSEEWRYATGYAITSRPAIVGDKAFVASEGPSLHAVSALTGQPLWQLDGASQFVALGKQHTYGMDRYGTLIVVDNQTGGIAGRLATGTSNSALVNDKSDRIYVVNNRGVVQCLHEIGAHEPTWHRDMAKNTDEPMSDEGEDALDGSGTREAESVEETPADVEDAGSASPFEPEEADSEDDDFNPFDDVF